MSFVNEAIVVHEGIVVQEAVHRLAARPPHRLAAVIVACYGRAGDPPQTLPAIDHRLGVTRQRVHQPHAEALLRLAYPARSLDLRRLLERKTTVDHQAYLARLRDWQQGRRKPR